MKNSDVRGLRVHQVAGWYCGISTARGLDHAAGIMLVSFGLVAALR